MKAQLKELAIQAKLPGYLLEYGTELCVAPHLEKFAELIVRECMKLNHEHFSDEDPYSIDSLYRQHFGFKE